MLNVTFFDVAFLVLLCVKDPFLLPRELIAKKMSVTFSLCHRFIISGDPARGPKKHWMKTT